MKRGSGIVLLIFLVSIFSGFATAGPARATIESKCQIRPDSNITVPNHIKGEVTLDGETVDEVDCSRISRYYIPVQPASMGLVDPGPEVPNWAMALFIAPLASLIVYSERRNYDLKSVLGYSSLTLFTSVLGLGIFTQLSGGLGLKPWIGVTSLLLGVAITPFVVLRNYSIRSSKARLYLGTWLTTGIVLFGFVLKYML